MADDRRIDVKLRLAFILPAVAILAVLAILAAAFPAFLQPLIIAMPVVLVIALGALLLTERNRAGAKRVRRLR